MINTDIIGQSQFQFLDFCSHDIAPMVKNAVNISLQRGSNPREPERGMLLLALGFLAQELPHLLQQAGVDHAEAALALDMIADCGESLLRLGVVL